MTIKRLAFALGLAVVSGFTHAADVPQGSKFDNRIQYVNYNDGDVVVVRSVAGTGSRIVFSPKETILDVASGFSQGWEFNDRDNVLYIKAKSIKGENGMAPMTPEAGKWDTNLMVKTNLRLYDFDLQLLPGASSSRVPPNQKIAYRVEFKYPEEEAAQTKALEAKQKAQAKLDAEDGPRNWDYSMQVGDASDNIAPTMAYDNGRFTFLRFPNNRDFPTAFLVGPDKSESLVNSHIDPAKPDVLVIHRVAREMVLRLGNAVVGIYNDSFDADGVPANDGTTVPGVKRVLRAEGNNQ